MTSPSAAQQARQQARQRAAELCDLLTKASYDYYIRDRPTLADAAYDRLFRELQAIEQEHPELRGDDSPTKRVGATPAESFAKHEHLVPMGSLANAFDDDEVTAWYERAVKIAGTAVDSAGFSAEL